MHETTETTHKDDDNTSEVEKDTENDKSEAVELNEDGYMRNRTFENSSQSDYSDDSDDETKCDLCDFNTDVKANLTKHKENIHHLCCMCDQCDKMFESRMKMKNHKYVVHSVKYYTTYD